MPLIDLITSTFFTCTWCSARPWTGQTLTEELLTGAELQRPSVDCSRIVFREQPEDVIELSIGLA